MAGYDPKKAAEYNKLIQQGVNPEAAIAQAGITDDEAGNYQINNVGTPATNKDYGKMSAIDIGQGKVAGVDYDTAPATTTVSQSQVTSYSYTTTSTETVSGGGTTTITAGPRISTAQSQVYADAGVAKQVEIDQYIKDNPSNFLRKRQGLPPLTPEENLARDAELNRLQDQRSQLYNQQIDAESPSQPTITSTPNTTTTTQTVVSQTSATNTAVNFDQDEYLSQSTETQLEQTTTTANFNSARDSSVNPASDPSQFPAYDDEGNLMPGYAINDETGDTYYQGLGPLTQQTAGFDPNYDEFGNYDAAVAAQRIESTTPSEINDPYYGLSPEQLQWLGNADPTDPYIRARGGLPQLPGSILAVTAGFGTIKTGVKAIDSALGIIGGISTLFAGIGNIANSIGGLFGGKPTATTAAATTGMSVAGLTTPAPTPAKKDTAVNPASDPSQFPAYDDEGNLMPGYAINEETGQTYYHGVVPTKDNSVNPASDPSQFPAYDDEGNLMPGYAINEETGQTYYHGQVPGTRDTGVNPASDPSQFPAYDDEGNLMPGYAINEETGQTYYHGQTPGTRDTAFNPASDPSQFPAYDDEGNLLPGYAVNDETGETYYHGQTPGTTDQAVSGPTDYGTTYDEFGSVVPKGPPVSNTTVYGDFGEELQTAALTTGTDSTTLSADQADAFYNGTGTLTPSERAAQDAQTAADAAVLYPGTNNTNLRNINEASGAIAQNEAGIANAEKIIAANNAELADPNISDARRAELEANNAEQYDYIQVATENTAINQNVIEQNADAFAAGGGEPDSGQGPMEVDALTDPELEEVVVEEGPPVEDVIVDNAEDPQYADYDIPNDQPAEWYDAGLVDPAEDPFEQARLDAEATAAEEGPTDANLEVDALTDEELAVQEAYQQDQRDALASENFNEYEDVNASDDEALTVPPGAEDEQVESEEPFALNPDEDEGLPQDADATEPDAQGDEDSFQGSQEASIRQKAKNQATLQSRYKQPGNTDWRVRLLLGPNSNYLYNASPPGILAPLMATNGVIFPYTPTITTTYSANYEQYDLVHSNYRGLFYKNSRVGDVQLRGVFTAQDTTEASYLLAVIHFFRSVTKMFYGKDAERGTPPPLVYLNGYGDYQFSQHPCVVAAFNYTLPSDVDYIRAVNPNNYGLNLLSRRSPIASNPGGTNLSGALRLLNALPGGLAKGALPQTPAPGPVPGSVSNTSLSTYVPTKMEIDITLIPLQTRSQVSKQFSLKGFANGDLIKGGFW